MQRENALRSGWTNAGVVGLKQGDLDALFLEIALCLSKIQRCMVRRCVPATESCYQSDARSSVFRVPYQLVRNVILSVDILQVFRVGRKAGMVSLIYAMGRGGED